MSQQLSLCHVSVSSSATWVGMDQDLTLTHMLSHTWNLGITVGTVSRWLLGAPNPPQWSSPGGPAWHSSACSLRGPAHGWSRDADRAPGTASAPGPGNSRPCTTSSFSPTSQKTTSVPAGGQRARSHATLSASMNLCATTTQTLCSRMRRTPTQTASWLRWDWCEGFCCMLTMLVSSEPSDTWWLMCGKNNEMCRQGRVSSSFTEGCSQWCLLNIFKPVPLLDDWLTTFTWGGETAVHSSQPSTQRGTFTSNHITSCVVCRSLPYLPLPGS